MSSGTVSPSAVVLFVKVTVSGVVPLSTSPSNAGVMLCALRMAKAIALRTLVPGTTSQLTWKPLSSIVTVSARMALVSEPASVGICRKREESARLSVFMVTAASSSATEIPQRVPPASSMYEPMP